MSDTPQGPDWWQASDGKWYAPQPAPPPPSYPPPAAGMAYGQPTVPASPWTAYGPPVSVTNGMAVAALVLGIIGAAAGLIPWTFLFAWILGALAVIFGFVARARAKRTNVGRGMSRAGVILGFAAIGLGIVGVAIVAATTDNVDNRSRPTNVNPVSPTTVESFAPTTTEDFAPVGPSDSTIQQQSCDVDEFGIAKATGTITNESGHPHRFTIGVMFLGPDGDTVGLGWDYKDLADGETAAYDTGNPVPNGITHVTCEVAAE